MEKDEKEDIEGLLTLKTKDPRLKKTIEKVGGLQRSKALLDID